MTLVTDSIWGNSLIIFFTLTRSLQLTIVIEKLHLIIQIVAPTLPLFHTMYLTFFLSKSIFSFSKRSFSFSTCSLFCCGKQSWTSFMQCLICHIKKLNCVIIHQLINAFLAFPWLSRRYLPWTCNRTNRSSIIIDWVGVVAVSFLSNTNCWPLNSSTVLSNPPSHLSGLFRLASCLVQKALRDHHWSIWACCRLSGVGHQILQRWCCHCCHQKNDQVQLCLWSSLADLDHNWLLRVLCLMNWP